MGRALYAQYPVFRRELDACDQLFAPHLGRSISELMFGDADGADADLQQTLYTQPALFAFEYAAARLWMSWGVKPSVLLGHSIGEIVAATLAGLFTLADATKLVAARARLMQSVAARGGMVAVRAGADAVAPLLEGHPNVSFGAINAPEQCVLSGDVVALASITEALKLRGITARALPVSHAFHSPLMAEVLDAFRSAIQDIEFREPESSFVSNLTGKVATLAEVGRPEYLGPPHRRAGELPGRHALRAEARQACVRRGRTVRRPDQSGQAVRRRLRTPVALELDAVARRGRRDDSQGAGRGLHRRPHRLVGRLSPAAARASHRGTELRLRPQALLDSLEARRKAGRRHHRRRPPSVARRGDFLERTARGRRARVPDLSRPVEAGVPRRSRRDGSGRVSRRGLRRSRCSRSRTRCSARPRASSASCASTSPCS